MVLHMEDIVTQTAVRNGRTPTPHFEVVQVTPALAAEWLEHNTHNRPVKWRSVKQYAGAIRRGEWKLNGDSIRFDYNGVLIDGQNRLWAIVEADTPVTTLVGTGLEPEAQDTIDIGARRSLADTLVLMKEVNAHRTASVIRWCWLWERHLSTGAPVDHRHEPPTLQQLVAFFKSRRSRIVTAVSEGERLHRKFKAAPSAMVGVGWYIFHEMNWEDCQDFYFKLGKGASLEEDNPIFVLRRWFMNQHERRERARPDVVLAILVKAWNLYRDGGRIQHLRWVGGGATPEQFPVAR